VLNLLRGLNPRYRHLKPIITSKSPPHNFALARSFLLLEELCDKHDDKVASGQAYAASHGNSSSNTEKVSYPRNKCQKNRRRGGSSGNNSGGTSRGSFAGLFGGSQGPRSSAQTGGSTGAQQPPTAPAGLPWAAGYNPWTGLVQAWPMPFRVLGAGVLGPCPPIQHQQAMTAHHQLMHPAHPSPAPPLWDQNAFCLHVHRRSSPDTSTSQCPGPVLGLCSRGDRRGPTLERGPR
jgi:hypothetical protein